MKKPLFLALAAVATAFVATAAHAGGQVYWSIGVNAPPLSTVISNGPVYGSGYGGSYGGGYGGGYNGGYGGGYGAGYGPGPAVTYVPAPVYVPAPPLWRPPPVYQVVPRVVYLPPVQIGYGGRWYQPEPQRWQGRDRDRDHGRGRDRDRDGIPDRYDHDDGDRRGSWGAEQDRGQDWRDGRDDRKYRH